MGGAWIGFRARGSWGKKGEPVRPPRVISAVESATERDHCDRSGPRGQSRNRFSSRSRSNGRTAGQGSILRTTTARDGHASAKIARKLNSPIAPKRDRDRSRAASFHLGTDTVFVPFKPLPGIRAGPPRAGSRRRRPRGSPAWAGSLRPTATGDFRFTGGIEWIPLTPVVPGAGRRARAEVVSLSPPSFPGRPTRKTLRALGS